MGAQALALMILALSSFFGECDGCSHANPPPQETESLAGSGSVYLEYNPGPLSDGCDTVWATHGGVVAASVWGQQHPQDMLNMPSLLDCTNSLLSDGNLDFEGSWGEECRAMMLGLHAGMHLTQFNSDRHYFVVHCQLTHDMLKLVIDMGGGRISEIPLTQMSKVSHAEKRSKSSPSIDLCCQPEHQRRKEHLIILEFDDLSHAFTFKQSRHATCFMRCIELLILRGKCKRDGRVSLTV